MPSFCMMACGGELLCAMASSLAAEPQVRRAAAGVAGMRALTVVACTPRQQAGGMPDRCRALSRHGGLPRYYVSKLKADL